MMFPIQIQISSKLTSQTAECKHTKQNTRFHSKDVSEQYEPPIGLVIDHGKNETDQIKLKQAFSDDDDLEAHPVPADHNPRST